MGPESSILRTLSNEELLDKAASTAGTVEFHNEELDRIRSERDEALRSVNDRLVKTEKEKAEAERAHQDVMEELARRMIAHKVTTIRDWRGTFHLEYPVSGDVPLAQFVAGDGGQISWLDWTSLEPYPDASSVRAALENLGKVA